MFYRQIIPVTVGMKVAGHMVTSELDPDTEVESYDWEEHTAYDANTVVFYNDTLYVSVRNVPDNAGSPDTEPDFWGWLAINF